MTEIEVHVAELGQLFNAIVMTENSFNSTLSDGISQASIFGPLDNFALSLSGKVDAASEAFRMSEFAFLQPDRGDYVIAYALSGKR